MYTRTQVSSDNKEKDSEEVIDSLNKAPSATPPSATPPQPEITLSEVKQKPVKRLESSILAAAIVNSAPLRRRQVFLQPSHSFDHSPSSSSSPDSDLKRRSWYVERVTARMLSVLEETGSSFDALPAFNRSYSSESKTNG